MMEDSDTEWYDREMVYLGDHPCVRWCGSNSESSHERCRLQNTHIEARSCTTKWASRWNTPMVV